MRTAMRSHSSGALRASENGENVTLCGWVSARRDHGGVTFIDIRDREGVVQVVFHPEDAAEAHSAAQHLGSEDVVCIQGAVRLRPKGMINPAIGTGQIEVLASSVEVISAADTPPFPIEDRVEAGEDLRLRYRYLDLRRPEMTKILKMRHDINSMIREHMEAAGFLEVETPILTRSTPEGARDFLVPSRLSPGTFYALPQSPQQLKQLLMVAGQDRYYQIVRCLRDEAPRADRSFEFTQLDVEMSFVDEEDIFGLIEPLYARIVQEMRGVEVQTPFMRMTHEEMLRRYGSDKADLRYGMELADLAGVFEGTAFNAFAGVLSSGGKIKGLAAPGGSVLSRKELDQLIQDTKGRGAAGLVWMVVESDGSLRSPVDKFLSTEELEGIKSAVGAAPGDLILIVADKEDRTNVALDGLRRDMAVRLDLIPENAWAFCWLVEPKLFEWSDEEEKWVSAHHPFTSPASEDLEPTTANSRGYDLVLNGFEVGGGSIRIHRADIQHRVFEVLGLPEDEIQEKFGHLLTAFRYGVPPHGGIAMGIDRMVMLMAGKEAIRDVTAFPKAQSGADPLTGAPSPASMLQLRELGLRVPEPPKKED